MPLTFKEKQELAALEKEFAGAPAPSGGLTPQEEAELAQLEAEFSNPKNQPSYAGTYLAGTEPDLGFVTRTKYSLEPIEANREEILRQALGPENVGRDPKTNELVVKQDGYWMPVNKPGISFTDVTDIAGALPEMIPATIGAGIGGTAGALLSAPTGGVAAPIAIPGGVAAGRAIGGAVGNAFRQGLSAVVSPGEQVATPSERLVSAGVSGLTNMAVGGLLDKILPKKVISKPVQSIAEQAVKTEASQIPETATSKEVTSALNEILPEQTFDNLTPNESQLREPIKRELSKLKAIATEQGLPEPTFAQAAGGESILAEGRLANTILKGKKLRDQLDKQVAGVRKNIEDIVGKVEADAESKAFDLGLAAKDAAKANVKNIKNISRELYAQVENAAGDARVFRPVLRQKLFQNTSEFKLFNEDGGLSRYRLDSGLKRDTFEKLQTIIKDAADSLKGESNTIPYNKAILSAQVIGEEAKAAKSAGDKQLAKVLGSIKEDLENSIQGSLNRSSKGAGEAFKEARNLWRKSYEHQEIIDDIIGDNVAPEKALAKIFSNTDNVTKMQKVVGNERVREMAISHINDKLKPLTKSGVARADVALAELRKLKPVIEESIGKEKYSTLVKNLYYLNRVNQPFETSRASLYSLLTKPSVSSVVQTAKDIQLTRPPINTSGGAGQSVFSKALGGVGSGVSGAAGAARNPQYYGGIGNVLLEPKKQDIKRGLGQ